jgi:hypothetical protein
MAFDPQELEERRILPRGGEWNLWMNSLLPKSILVFHARVHLVSELPHSCRIDSAQVRLDMFFHIKDSDRTIS